MLKSLRSKLTSWLMLGFLAIAVASLVFTDFGSGGIGNLGGGGSQGRGQTLVEVGDEEIKSDELDALIRRRLRDAQRQDPEFDMERFLGLGAFEALLDQMVVGRALWQFGRDHGFIVSDRMIDRLIASVPAFHNLGGQFDNNVFRQTIQAQGLTEQQVRQDVANLLMQRQLQMPIGLNARAPDSMTLQYASLLLERRRGTIGLIRFETLAQGIQPSDAEINAFYARNRARYTMPERRVLRYAMISREQVAANARATDQEIEAYYRQNQARYAGTETRTLQQVVLRDEAAARQFVARANGGANFVAAAGEARFSPEDVALGAQSREQFTTLTSPEVANAVFSAAQGTMVGPLRSPLGWHVVRVESINQAAARPLASVRAEIATEIERRKAEDALAGLIGRIEDKVAEGNSFEDIARSESLAIVETPPVTAAGAAPGAQWQAPQEVPALARAAFQLDPEDPEPVIETLAPNERFAFMALGRVIPAAVQPLQQVREQVRADLVRQQASERARRIADRVAQRINGGTAAATAFAEAGVRVESEPIAARRLDVARRGNQVPPALSALFALPQGRARAVPAQNGIYIVVVQQRIPGQASCPRGQQTGEGCEAILLARGDLDGNLGGELTEQFARAAQNAIEIRRDDGAIAEARRALLANR